MEFLFVANLTLGLRIGVVAALDLTVAQEGGLWYLFGGDSEIEGKETS